TQHLDEINLDMLKEDIRKHVIDEVISEEYIDEDAKTYINPTGRFVIGGPKGDTGLTGRKIIVDTYGRYSPHGGGAFSGKDASKVDRSAAYMLRHIAKNIVANGLARRCQIEIAYAIGMEEPVSLYINTFGTNIISEEGIAKKVERFDLTPKGIIEYLNLREPIYTGTTNYGHFGKNDLSWEKIIVL
ncbi:MAG: methionine adenosyltransferase domain-containing protein, partial [Oscillospiraceae bacterium]|nr:methionine adenosyltransferase domain-containing protein [Oscillospiraceae bacterium]